MATDSDVAQALIAAAEELLSRSLEPAEQEQLIELFNKTPGDLQKRARIALRKTAALSDDELQLKESSDNTERKMKDLRTKLDAWNQGKK